MLLEFSVENMFSFKDKTTFSMLASNLTDSSDYLIYENDLSILKTAAIYGANASGKTNLFSALNWVSRSLRDSVSMDITKPLKVPTFEFDDFRKNSTAYFEIKFIVNHICYWYGFRVGEVVGVYEEFLYYYPKGTKTLIFERSHGGV